jgi:hypothetical protein
MEQQLPLFACKLAPTDQQTIRTALTLLNASYASQVQHLHPATQYATCYACSLPRLTAKPSPFCGSTISTV